MQRLTKFRLAIGTLSIGCVATAAYAVSVHRDAIRLEAEVARAEHRASESASKAASAVARASLLEHELQDGSAERSQSSSVIAAFANQAVACEAVKQQLHIKEKQDAHS